MSYISFVTIQVFFDIAQSFFDVPYIHAFLKTLIQSSYNEPTRNMLQLKKKI